MAVLLKDTESVSFDDSLYEWKGILTVTGWVETLGFFHQRFELSEFTQGLLGHSTVFDQSTLNFLTHFGDVFRMSRKIIQSMSGGHAGSVN